jgi:predicted nucleic acid binding AN1-type Zn finger protein
MTEPTKQTEMNTQKSNNNTIETPKKKKKKSKNRCAFEGCRKKLNLATVTCKCNKRFCGLHRLQNQHNCPIINTLDKQKLMQKCGLGGGTFKKLEAI